MSSPDGATWRSGYATVCKTVYTSSILVVASINYFNNLIECLGTVGDCSPKPQEPPRGPPLNTMRPADMNFAGNTSSTSL